MGTYPGLSGRTPEQWLADCIVPTGKTAAEKLPWYDFCGPRDLWDAMVARVQALIDRRAGDRAFVEGKLRSILPQAPALPLAHVEKAVLLATGALIWDKPVGKIRRPLGPDERRIITPWEDPTREFFPTPYEIRREMVSELVPPIIY